MKNKSVQIEIAPHTVIWIGAFSIALFLLWKIRVVIFMLFLAFIINSALRPYVDRLEQRNIPRIISTALIYFIFVVLLVFAISTILTDTLQQFGELVKELPIIISNLAQIISGFFGSIVENVPGLDNVIAAETIKQQVLDFANGISTNEIRDLFSSGLIGAVSIINSTIYIVLSGFTVMMLSIYMLNKPGEVYQELFQIFPESKREKYLEILAKIEENLGNWLRGQLTLMFSVGLLTYVGFVLPSFFFEGYRLHEFALLLAFLAAITEVIPNFGPLLTAAIGVILAAGSAPLAPFWPMVYVTVLFAVIQQIESTLLTPNIMKKAIGLDPIITIVSLIAAFILFDLIGTILIIPFLAIVQIFIQAGLAEAKKKT